MLGEIKRIGKMSLDEVKYRKLFLSYIVCKNERNQDIIVGTGSPYLMTYNQGQIRVYKKEKLHISKAIMNAHRRGRMMPTNDDMEQRTEVTLRIGESGNINTKKPMDVYFLYI